MGTLPRNPETKPQNPGDHQYGCNKNRFFFLQNNLHFYHRFVKIISYSHSKGKYKLSVSNRKNNVVRSITGKIEIIHSGR